MLSRKCDRHIVGLEFNSTKKSNIVSPQRATVTNLNSQNNNANEDNDIEADLSVILDDVDDNVEVQSKKPKIFLSR